MLFAMHRFGICSHTAVSVKAVWGESLVRHSQRPSGSRAGRLAVVVHANLLGTFQPY